MFRPLAEEGEQEGDCCLIPRAKVSSTLPLPGFCSQHLAGGSPMLSLGRASGTMSLFSMRDN